MKKIVFKEQKYGLSILYLIIIGLLAIIINYYLLFLIILITPFFLIFGEKLKLIDTIIYEDRIEYSTVLLLNRGTIKFKNIKNVEIIEFQIFFDTPFYKSYHYCNSSRISEIQYGISIELDDNQKRIIPTEKPKKIIDVINEKLIN